MYDGLIRDTIDTLKCLCDGFLDMPSGCEGCPIFDEDDYCDEKPCDKDKVIEKLEELFLF